MSDEEEGGEEDAFGGVYARTLFYGRDAALRIYELIERSHGLHCQFCD